MSLVRYEPWSLFDRFQEELNHLTRNDYFGKDVIDGDNSNIVTSHWRPAVDIKEEKNRFVIQADVPGVLDIQDLIANKAKDISGLILGRKMSLPSQLNDSYMNFLNRCIDATKQAQVAINELDELVVTGFRGNEANRVKKMIAELHIIEGETDVIQVKLRAELYAIEKDLSPIDVMFIYKIIEWTGDLADAAQSTGNRLQLMLAK